MPTLIHSELSEAQQQRVIRIGTDICALRDTLTRAQIRTVYDTLKEVRNALSRMLDKVDHD